MAWVLGVVRTTIWIMTGTLTLYGLILVTDPIRRHAGLPEPTAHDLVATA